jgi:hypothetical protein
LTELNLLVIFLGLMKKVLFIFVIMVLSARYALPAGALSNTVLINELQTQGTGGATDEFIELVNVSDHPITGLSLKYLTASASTTSTLISNIGTIGPGEYKVFTTRSSGTKLSMSSVGGHVILYDGATVIDKVGWGTASDPEGAAVAAHGVGESIARKDFSDTDNNKNDFAISSKPTPGAKNIFGASTGGDPGATSYAKLSINELLPNPKGTDSGSEFVEIFNPHTFSVVVDGWKLADSRSSMKLKSAIAAQSYMVVKNTFSLNNTGGEKVTLSAPDGTKISSVSYSTSAKEGLAYANDGSKWRWTSTPTPGAQNIFVADSGSTGPSGPSIGTGPSSGSNGVSKTTITPIGADKNNQTISGDDPSKSYKVAGYSLILGSVIFILGSVLYAWRARFKKIGDNLDRRIEKL